VAWAQSGGAVVHDRHVFNSLDGWKMTAGVSAGRANGFPPAPEQIGGQQPKKHAVDFV
jgi:hypothetical protein